MVQPLAALPYAVALFIGMLVCLEIGRRAGVRAIAKDAKAAKSSVCGGGRFHFRSVCVVLLAFTFSGAPSRLDARKHLIADEANAIGTAYLRLDLLRADSQPEMRALFRNYLDSRLRVFRNDTLEAASGDLAKSSDLQMKIWSGAVAHHSTSRQSSGGRQAALASIKRNDRYHDHANDGRDDPPPSSYFCFAISARHGLLRAGRL